MDGKRAQIPVELTSWPGHVGNWGRWDNDRGALNLITPEATLRGVASVRTGRVITCARDALPHDPVIEPSLGIITKMDSCGTKYGTTNCQSAKDQATYQTHGMLNTHIDALCHNGFKGYAFNGHRFTDVVNMEQGALRLDAQHLRGIVTRGIFIDVARARGINGLRRGDFVRPEEVIEPLKRAQPGDVVVVRTGVTNTGWGRSADGKLHVGGFHPECIDLFGRADIAVVASDSGSETFPSAIIGICEIPVHVLSEVIWGMPLVHNMYLEELSAACLETSRTEFLFTVSPLNIPHATGSMCTPVVVL